MRKRAYGFAFFPVALALCITAAGCAGMDILDEIPKNFSMVSERTSETMTEASAGFPTTGTGITVAREESDHKEPEGESFLMEEACSFACDRLNEAEQIWYHDIEQILGTYGEQTALSAECFAEGLDENDIDKIFQCVIGDHPELFYVEGYSYTKYTRGGRLCAIEFSGTYSVDRETARKRKEEILAAADVILSGIDKNASDYDKVKYVYDTIIRNTDYDINVEDNQNIYSVFKHRLSVCQGYAKATQYLLNRLGVECMLVLGTVETGESHAWNLVKVDGSYYYVDSTWGDVSYKKADEDLEQENKYDFQMPEINYDYLNVTTEELLRTHAIGGVVDMPDCTADEANYYVKEGALFLTYDKEQIAELFRKAAENAQKNVTVKCADAACYEDIVQALIEEQGIFAYLDNIESVAYTLNEKQLSLTFWVANE